MAEPTKLTAIKFAAREESAAVYVAAGRYTDDLVVVTVDGEIDLSNISQFEKELADHRLEPWLVLDMSGVRFCGVVGARLLHTMANESSTAGRRFEVIDNPAIARVLVATGLADGITRRTLQSAHSRSRVS
jgi:anti-anti-sigma factor